MAVVPGPDLGIYAEHIEENVNRQLYNGEHGHQDARDVTDAMDAANDGYVMDALDVENDGDARDKDAEFDGDTAAGNTDGPVHNAVGDADETRDADDGNEDADSSRHQDRVRTP